MLNRFDNGFLLPSLISITSHSSSSSSCFMSSLFPVFVTTPPFCFILQHIPRVPLPNSPFLLPCVSLISLDSLKTLVSHFLPPSYCTYKKRRNTTLEDGKGKSRGGESQMENKNRSVCAPPPPPPFSALCDFMLAASLPRCTPSLSCLFAQLIFPLLYMPSEAAAHWSSHTPSALQPERSLRSPLTNARWQEFTHRL